MNIMIATLLRLGLREVSLSLLILFSAESLRSQTTSAASSPGQSQASDSEMISTFDDFQRGYDAKGVIASINEDPAFSESGRSLRIEPMFGFDTAVMQFNWRQPSGAFTGAGIKFWAKSTSQKVVMSVVLSIQRPEPLKHATYSANVVVSNRGSMIVVPFSEFVHQSGATLDFPAEVGNYLTYVYLKFYQTPISTVYIDSLQLMSSEDAKTETILGPPDVVNADPDLAYEPSLESSDGPPMLFNFSKLPSGFSVKGLKVDENGAPSLVTNPQKTDGGTAVKLEPVYGNNLANTQFNFRVPAGSITGSGIKFWAKADAEGTVLDFIIEAGSGDRGTYATQIALSTTGTTYEIPFKDLQQRSGRPVNIGQSARDSMAYVFFKFFKAPISTVYLDSIENIEFDPAFEAANPVESPVAPPSIAEIPPSMPVAPGVDPSDTAEIDDPKWKLAWSDEFDGPEIDLKSWSHAPPQNRNSEIGYFTSRPENSRIENGNLVIESLKENYRNLAAYTSAELITKGKVGFLYGKLEIYAKLPGGKGAWPAFWLLGEEGAWPANGELDVIEMIGGPNDGATKGENVANGSMHWQDTTGRHKSSGVHYTLPEGSFTDSYHKIGMLWSKGKIRWYIDDHIYREQDITSADYAAFHKKMYVLLNTSIGGGWPGNPDETTVFPMRYNIDYLRYYTYEGAPSDESIKGSPNLP